MKYRNTEKTDFGVLGLGVMGSALSENLLEKGFRLSVYNRETENESGVVDSFLSKCNAESNVNGFINLAEFVESIKTPRSILIMIKAGDAIDQTLEQLIPLLSNGDIVLDGGNSHYLNTEKRIAKMKNHNINFLGVGISGGEKGARNGPSIMPGGSLDGYSMVSTILESISAKDSGGKPCCTFIGKGGSGHYVKMVHNGIEYAEMQLLAEVYQFLKCSYSIEKIISLFKQWNRGSLNSYLLEITIEILKTKDGNDFLLDKILDKAANKGTGGWSSESSIKLGTVNSLMTVSVFARYLSSYKNQRNELSKLVTKTSKKTSIDSDSIRKAYSFSRLINHIQGFQLLNSASEEYDWNLNLSEISRIWTNGCIIRSKLMEDLTSHLRTNNSLIENSAINSFLLDTESYISSYLINSINNRIASPVFSSAYNYWIGMTTEKSPANLIQAQRDFFGAHTYQRNDDSGLNNYHTDWENT